MAAEQAAGPVSLPAAADRTGLFAGTEQVSAILNHRLCLELQARPRLGDGPFDKSRRERRPKNEQPAETADHYLAAGSFSEPDDCTRRPLRIVDRENRTGGAPTVVRRVLIDRRVERCW